VISSFSSTIIFLDPPVARLAEQAESL